MSDADYAAAFATLVLPVLRAYAPDLLLVSAGFDAAEGDAQGRMRLTPRGFGEMTAALLALNVPMALALEGGYNHAVTARCCEAVIRTLLGEPPPAAATQPRLSKCTEQTLRRALQLQLPHWPVLRERRRAFDAYFADADGRAAAPERASRRKRKGVCEWE